MVQTHMTIRFLLDVTPKPSVLQATAEIAVPRVRDVPDYTSNQAALEARCSRYKGIGTVNTAYIRNQALFAPQTMEQVGLARGSGVLGQ